MTTPITHRTSSANGWLGVFGSANRRTDESAAGKKDVVRRLTSVTQVGTADHPAGTDTRNTPVDEARRLREIRISRAIDSVPIDMAPRLKPKFLALRIIGAVGEADMQYALDAIDRACAYMTSGHPVAARDMLQEALNNLPLNREAGGPTPPAARYPVAPECPVRGPSG
ncbi:hypothetical protein [Pinirhizobacter sp.]|jgi:hypothetical protein|uniref:hypothetical protein n=1 Tax=Pinirhizobacter sp. TaxID=2950432 RepID=UPI002F40284E